MLCPPPPLPIAWHSAFREGRSTVQGLPPRSLVLGGAAGLCTPQTTSEFLLGASCKLRRQRRTLSPFLQRNYSFFIWERYLCWAKKKVHSSPFDFKSLIALQIPHLWPPAVQILLKEVKLAEDRIPPATILLQDHLPLKNNVE